mgnify:CR=1 FL=1
MNALRFEVQECSGQTDGHWRTWKQPRDGYEVMPDEDGRFDEDDRRAIGRD